MSEIRKIKSQLKAIPSVDGAGVALKRVFGYSQQGELDPFLLLDEFGSDKPEDYLAGFPFHPHRGIETITYLLRGSVEHKDSLGNSGTIKPGYLQWMSAGSGIIHQEMPIAPEDGVLRGFQLWANLPKSEKMSSPRYRDIHADMIPETISEGGTQIKVISGTLEGIKGPVSEVTIDPLYAHITIPPNTDFSTLINPEYKLFAYVVEGSGYFEPDHRGQKENTVDTESLVIYGQGDRIDISSSSGGLSFLLVGGKPLNEPVAWYGPIVMNTQEELRKAFDEYRTGTFIK